MPLLMTIDDLHEFMRSEFPQVASSFRIEKLSRGEISVRMFVGPENSRPGGTVSGPAMFSLADVTIYLAVLAMIGPQKLAVTTSCSIDFMRKPGLVDLHADGRILKLGRRLAVGDALLRSEGSSVPVARASITYSLPGPAAQ